MAERRRGYECLGRFADTGRNPDTGKARSAGRKSIDACAGEKRDSTSDRYSSSDSVGHRDSKPVAKNFAQTQPKEKDLTEADSFFRKEET